MKKSALILYLSYVLFFSINDGGKSKEAGQTIFSNLRHETTHAVQFEYGELGFENDGGVKWTPVNYDIMDEYEAHNNQNFGFRWTSGHKTTRDKWTNQKTTHEMRIKALENVYTNIPSESCNNENLSKIKNTEQYALPYRKRSTIGKSKDDASIVFWYEPPFFDWHSIFVRKNDTIFELKIFEVKDSVVLGDTYVHLRGGWWLMLSNTHERIVVERFRKIRPSPDFKKCREFVLADYEVECTRMFVYNQDLKLCNHYFKIGHLAYASGEIEQPKRKMKKRILNAYKQYQH